MTSGRKGVRGAAAGFALAAAGMIYSRLGGAREAPEQPAGTASDEPREGGASSEEVARARSELAHELARRASLTER